MERNDVITVTHPYDTAAPDGSGPTHLAVIARVNARPGPWANVWLCHTTPAMATEWDLLIHLGGRRLVICPELCAQVLADQVTGTVGRLSDADFDALDQAFSSDGASLPEPRPAPRRGVGDPRRAWLERWIPVTRDLSGPARALLI